MKTYSFCYSFRYPISTYVSIYPIMSAPILTSRDILARENFISSIELSLQVVQAIVCSDMTDEEYASKYLNPKDIMLEIIGFIRKDDMEQFKKYLDFYPFSSEMKGILLSCAAALDKLWMTKTLVESGANSVRFSLLAAISLGSSQYLVSYLIEEKRKLVKPNDKAIWNIFLKLAATMQRNYLYKHLTEAGADNFEECLNIAIVNNDQESVEYFSTRSKIQQKQILTSQYVTGEDSRITNILLASK